MKTARFKDARRCMLIGRTKRLKAEGYTCAEIAEKLKLNESTVRSYMDIIDKADENQRKNGEA